MQSCSVIFLLMPGPALSRTAMKAKQIWLHLTLDPENQPIEVILESISGAENTYKIQVRSLVVVVPNTGHTLPIAISIHYPDHGL